MVCGKWLMVNSKIVVQVEVGVFFPETIGVQVAKAPPNQNALLR